MQKRVEIFLIFLIASILIFSCNKKTDVEKPDSNINIRLGLNRSVKSAPAVIAESSGYFSENHLDVELTIKPSVINMMDSLFREEYDIVCVPEYQVVNYSFSNRDFSILAVLNRNQSRSLVMNRDVLKSPADLAGTRIGLAGNSAGEYTLYRLLVFNNIEYNSVEIVYKKPQELSDALVNGEVDSIIVWSPFTYEAVKKMGKKAVVINAQLGRDMYWLLVSGGKWAEKNSEAVEAFLESLEKSYNLIKKKPDEAQQITASFLSLDPGSVKDEWKEYIFYLDLPQSLLLAMEQEAKWKQKQLPGNPEVIDFMDLIDCRYLEKLYPERVTLIR